jgi:hypothetical protein
MLVVKLFLAQIIPNNLFQQKIGSMHLWVELKSFPLPWERDTAGCLAASNCSPSEQGTQAVH